MLEPVAAATADQVMDTLRDALLKLLVPADRDIEVSKNGASEEIDTENWKQGKKLKTAILAAFPEEIVREFPNV